jgi:hypothetical protein
MSIYTRSQRELLALVVLRNTSVHRIAESWGNASRLMGELVAILDQLAAYFSAEIDEALARGIAA